MTYDPRFSTGDKDPAVRRPGATPRSLAEFYEEPNDLDDDGQELTEVFR